MAAEKVLLYHFEDGEKLKKFVFLMAVRLKMKLKVVEYKDYNKTLGYLLNGNGEGEDTADYDGEDMAEPMMVMQGLSGRRMDELLRTMKQNGIPAIGLKAVVTEHNLSWDSMKLYEELKSEREKLG